MEAVELTDPCTIDLHLLDGTFVRHARRHVLAPREHAFLAVLATSSRPRSPEDLADSLWPNHESDPARTCVKVYASRVRSRLGRRDAVVSDRTGYRLGPAISVDTWAIESLIAAAKAPARCAAPRLLDDAGAALQLLAQPVPRALRTVPLMQRYLARIAGELAALVFKDAWRQGDYPRAADAGLSLLGSDPCDEFGLELAMRGQLAMGDELGAVRTYRDYARALHEELDAEPSARLRALIHEGRAVGWSPFTEFSPDRIGAFAP